MPVLGLPDGWSAVRIRDAFVYFHEKTRVFTLSFPFTVEHVEELSKDDTFDCLFRETTEVLKEKGIMSLFESVKVDLDQTEVDVVKALNGENKENESVHHNHSVLDHSTSDQISITQSHIHPELDQTQEIKLISALKEKKAEFPLEDKILLIEENELVSKIGNLRFPPYVLMQSFKMSDESLKIKEHGNTDPVYF